jgi:hypothetical protein
MTRDWLLLLALIGLRLFSLHVSDVLPRDVAQTFLRIF